MLLAAIPKMERRRLLRFFTLMPGVIGLMVSIIGIVEIIVWKLGVGSPVDPTSNRLLMMPADRNMLHPRRACPGRGAAT